MGEGPCPGATWSWSITPFRTARGPGHPKGCNSSDFCLSVSELYGASERQGLRLQVFSLQEVQNLWKRVSGHLLKKETGFGLNRHQNICLATWRGFYSQYMSLRMCSFPGDDTSWKPIPRPADALAAQEPSGRHIWCPCQCSFSHSSQSL